MLQLKERMPGTPETGATHARRRLESDGRTLTINACDSETRFVLRLKVKDPVAFDELVSLYRGRLLSVIRRIVKNEDDAQDCLQDTFLQAYRGIGRFEGRSSIASWLYRIAINAGLMRLRTHRRRAEYPLDTSGSSTGDEGFNTTEVESDLDWPDRALERREDQVRVHRAIAELSESARTILMLRDIRELTTDEAAQELGITPGAVKVRLHRARAALRIKLEGLSAEG